MSVVLALLIAGAACGALTPLVIVGLRTSGTFDLPNDRSSHTEVLPRGGGIAIVVSVVLAVLLVRAANGPTLHLLVIAIALAVLGFLDDRAGIPPATRLGFQLAAGMAVGFVVSHATDYSVFLLSGALIATVYGINAFNFMDGINGISGIHCALFATVIGIELLRVDEQDGGVVAFALFGAALAFLPYNFPGARVFLGDVGSYFIGGLLAALSVYAVALGASPLLIASTCSYYLVDTATTVVARLRQRANIFVAHRDHTYQLLVRSGRSHTTSTTVALGLSLLGLCSALLFSRFLSHQTSLALTFTLVLVVVTLLRYRATTRLVLS